MEIFILATTTDDDDITITVHPSHADAVEYLRDTFIGDDGPGMTDEQVLERLTDWTEIKCAITAHTATPSE